MKKEEMAKAYAEGFAKEYREIAYDAFLCGYDAKCSTEIPKDLDAYAQKVEDYYNVGEERGYLCVHRGEVKDAVIAGAKWQKEQMMKEAVDTDVMLIPHDKAGDVSLHTGYLPKELGIKCDDKVRVIIVKENGK